MRSSVDNITPGPWHVEESLDEHGEGEGFFHVCHPGTQCESTVVATVSDLEADVATLKANATLIAAAPDLLQALRGLLDWAATIHKAGPALTSLDGDILTSGPVYEAAHRAVRNATCYHDWITEGASNDIVGEQSWQRCRKCGLAED